MPLSFSTVTDNSLLPFAQPGSYMVPHGDDNVGEWFSIMSTFESGLQLGARTLNGLRVFTNGDIQFSTGAGFVNTYLFPIRMDQDSRALPAGVTNAGIWIEENTDRDSIVITWNGIGQYYRNISAPSTYQVEIIDRGDGDAEIIYRFNELSTTRSTYYYYANGQIRTQTAEGGFNTYVSHLAVLDIPFAQWDEVEGNTGVTGVWQIRVEDGVVQGGDLRFPMQNLQGTEGDDSLTGGLAGDILRGFGGNDTLAGDFGNDSMTGDDGDDSIIGGNGNDYITGGLGHDDIRGGEGNDTIGAGNGDDTVFGDGGNDIINGAEGANRLLGGEGHDTITSGSGADAIDTGGGLNLVNSGAGNDTITGGSRNDTIHAGNGDDLIVGGNGNDYLTGGLGQDTINGGANHDYILAAEGDDVVYAGWGSDTVYGGDGHDLIADRSTSSAYWGTGNQFFGMEGNDTLTGGQQRDTILGGNGNDEIRGRNGQDLLAGGDGDDRILGDDDNLLSDHDHNDTIYGGNGNDWLFGGGGHDSIDGNTGTDTLLGGAGDDLLNGGVGDDFLFGGLGRDTLTGGPGADRFFISSFSADVSVITDYNADDGDWLVMPGDQFDPADLRLVGDRLYNLDGSVAEYVEVALVRIGPSGGIAQTLFEFDNPSQLDRLILRFPLEGDAGQVMELDLF